MRQKTRKLEFEDEVLSPDSRVEAYERQLEFEDLIASDMVAFQVERLTDVEYHNGERPF